MLKLRKLQARWRCTTSCPTRCQSTPARSPRRHAHFATLSCTGLLHCCSPQLASSVSPAAMPDICQALSALPSLGASLWGLAAALSSHMPVPCSRPAGRAPPCPSRIQRRSRTPSTGEQRAAWVQQAALKRPQGRSPRARRPRSSASTSTVLGWTEPGCHSSAGDCAQALAGPAVVDIECTPELRMLTAEAFLPC